MKNEGKKKDRGGESGGDSWGPGLHISGDIKNKMKDHLEQLSQIFHVALKEEERGLRELHKDEEDLNEAKRPQLKALCGINLCREIRPIKRPSGVTRHMWKHFQI